MRDLRKQLFKQGLHLSQTVACSHPNTCTQTSSLPLLCWGKISNKKNATKRKKTKSRLTIWCLAELEELSDSSRGDDQRMKDAFKLYIWTLKHKGTHESQRLVTPLITGDLKYMFGHYNPFQTAS